MNILTIGKWLVKGLTLVPALIQAMIAVEQLRTSDPGLAKRAAALDLAQRIISVTEGAAGRDLLDDAQILDAAGQVIDAVCALQKVIAKKSRGA